jgi:hypothetical protein
MRLGELSDDICNRLEPFEQIEPSCDLTGPCYALWVTWLYQDSVLGTPCGGGLPYLFRSPVSRKRWQEGNRASRDRVRYGLKFSGTWIREWLCWRGPAALARVNCRHVLSSERAPYTKNPNVWSKYASRERKINCRPRKWPDIRTDWPNGRRS